MPWRPSLQRRRIEIRGRIVKSMLSNSSEMFFLGTYWKTRYSMASKQTCTIDCEMDQSVWQTIISFDLLHSSHMWIQTILSRGKYSTTMQTGTVPRLWLCQRSWRLKIDLGENLVYPCAKILAKLMVEKWKSAMHHKIGVERRHILYVMRRFFCYKPPLTLQCETQGIKRLRVCLWAVWCVFFRCFESGAFMCPAIPKLATGPEFHNLARRTGSYCLRRLQVLWCESCVRQRKTEKNMRMGGTSGRYVVWCLDATCPTEVAGLRAYWISNNGELRARTPRKTRCQK